MSDPKCPMCGAKEVGPDDSGNNRYGCDECDYVASAAKFGVLAQLTLEERVARLEKTVAHLCPDMSHDV